MDIFLIILIIGCIAIGFFQGMIRVSIAIVALYLGLVLAALYYPSLGGFFARNFDTSRAVGEYVGFALVLFIAFVVLLIAGAYTFRYATLPGQLQYLDRIFGTIFGLLLGAFLIGIFASYLYTMLIIRDAAPDLPIMDSLVRSVRRSILIDFFMRTVLPQTYAILDPILPQGVELIFKAQSQ